MLDETPQMQETQLLTQFKMNLHALKDTSTYLVAFLNCNLLNARTCNKYNYVRNNVAYLIDISRYLTGRFVTNLITIKNANNRRHKLQKANGMAHAWEWDKQMAVGIYFW